MKQGPYLFPSSFFFDLLQVLQVVSLAVNLVCHVVQQGQKGGMHTKALLASYLALNG